MRGLVAAYQGHTYSGTDIRKEQVIANKEQLESHTLPELPVWACDDGANLAKYSPAADLIFSCPPYYNLERYSDLAGDLSTMLYSDFLTAYRQIIANACQLLKPNRFAVFVVGEVREGGFYVGLVKDTIAAFEQAGCYLYNDLVFLTPVGSLTLRAGKQMNASRKVAKAHQNVLVFYKGDPSQIPDNFPALELETED